MEHTQEISQSSTPQVDELYFNGIDEMINYLKKHKKHTLVLSVDSYAEKSDDTMWNANANDGIDRHVKRIGGAMLTNTHTFSGWVFDSTKMDYSNQIEFLRETKITYSKAMESTNQLLRDRLKKFLKENDVKTIIFWDEGNDYDLSIMQQDGILDLFKGMKLIFAEKVLTDAIGERNGLSISYVCSLFNIKIKQKKVDEIELYSVPFFKAQMIKKIFQTYLYQLNDDSRKHNKTIVLDNFA